MLLDFETIGDSAIPAADLVIVGAGAVGLLTAAEAADRGLRTLIVEAGGLGFEDRAQALNLAENVGMAHAGLATARPRVVGGATTLWGGQLVPFLPIDFETRPWIEHSGWPIDCDDLAPWYRQVLDRLGISRDPDEVVWRQLGIVRPESGPDLRFFLTRWLKEPNFRVFFWDRLSGKGALDCLYHANVTNIVEDPARVGAHALVVEGHRGRRVTLTARHIILAGGTVEASRLMLWAAECGAPWRGNRWLGAAFHDHLDGKTALIRPTNHRAFANLFDNLYVSGRKYQPKIELSAEAQRRLRLANIAGSIIFESSVQEHLANLKHLVRTLRRGALPETGAVDLAGMKELGKILLPLIKRYVVDRRAFNPWDRGVYLNVHCEQTPEPSSRITLDLDRRDALGIPAARLDWRLNGAEIEAIGSFTEAVAELMRSKGLAELELLDGVADRSESALAHVHDSNHSGGGLRMGRSAEDGVVDADLKVFGSRNLYIAGAAVFPTSGHANSTLTAMALGARLTGFLTSQTGAR
jgi:choline dehydrogenase-like flavoprotein